MDAVELGPIAGDPGGVARVRVLALFYGQVDKDCVVQHQGVGDRHGQPECVYYLHFLDYWLFYEDGVIDEQGVHFDFHLAEMGVSALIDEVSYCVDHVEKQQDSVNEGYDFEKILDCVVFDVLFVKFLAEFGVDVELDQIQVLQFLCSFLCLFEFLMAAVTPFAEPDISSKAIEGMYFIVGKV